MSNEVKSAEFLTAEQVMKRYGGVSHMWLFRRMQTAHFPAPVRFGGRMRFWRAGDLEAWERKTIAAESSKPLDPKSPRAGP